MTPDFFEQWSGKSLILPEVDRGRLSQTKFVLARRRLRPMKQEAADLSRSDDEWYSTMEA